MKQEDGGFATQIGGEIDIRSTYCALACAAILNILDYKLCQNTMQWIISLQTYQGGFGQEPNDEAHGGYAYCGVASLIIIHKYCKTNVTCDNSNDSGENISSNIKDLIDFDGLVRWCAMKQMSYSGGFCGRTNKLVDGCYSFWVGAIFPMINIINNEKDTNSDSSSNRHLVDNNDNNNDNNDNNSNIDQDAKEEEQEEKFQCYFDSLQLQKYLLIVAQHPVGAIVDKPTSLCEIHLN